MKINIIPRLRRELELRRLVPDPETRKKVIRARIPLHDMTSFEGMSLIKSLGIPVMGTHHSLIEAYSVLITLNDHAELKLDNVLGLPLISVNGVTFEVESSQDILILREVFVDTTYCVHSKRPTIVIDIGANIGASVLYFAGLPHVEKVIGFEPVKPTFDRAIANISRNPELSDKIQLHNFGLGNHDETLEIPFSIEKKGNVSLTHDTCRLGGGVLRETVQLKDAASILEPVITQYPDRSVVLKVDCEGGEYSILDALDRSGLLHRIDSFLIEFHYEGPEALRKTLIEHGFNVITLLEHNAIGMLYASKLPAL